jgi:hypothetical protein
MLCARCGQIEAVLRLRTRLRFAITFAGTFRTRLGARAAAVGRAFASSATTAPTTSATTTALAAAITTISPVATITALRTRAPFCSLSGRLRASFGLRRSLLLLL